MAHYAVSKGLDIPIAGGASGEVVDLPSPTKVSIDPRELTGFIPRLAAREGDLVQAGQPLMYHKFNQDLCVVSPIAGKVTKVARGLRRVITSFEVTPDPAAEGAVTHKAWSLSELDGIGADAALEQMLKGGIFPLISTRPLDQVADPEVKPQYVLIGAMETGPLQVGADALLSADDKDALQAAIKVLGAVSEGPVRLARSQAAHPALDGLTGVDVHTFDGPHPAGDPAVQVNLIEAPAGGKTVWTIRAWDAVVLGKLFLTGRFDPTRIYAAVGTGVQAPRLVRTLVGAPVSEVVGAVKAGDLRYIRGSVLTGTRTEATAGAGLRARTVHVLPDEVERVVLGWATPRLNTWSFHRAFLKGFGKAAKAFDLRPGVFGGHRAIVPVGYYDKVVATPDIVVDFLFKAILSGDIERSLKLGMLDITMEEAALCSYLCPSKIDFDVILREGLERYAKEA